MYLVKAKVQVTQSYPTLWYPMDYTAHGILQARILEYVQFSSVAQSCPILCDPMDCSTLGLPVHHQLLEFTQTHVHPIISSSVIPFSSHLAFPSPWDLPNPGIKPRSPTLWADSLPAEPQGKPKNNGVGSPSIFQRIFPTQESNQGLLHCRHIFYQLSYQGSPW